MRGFRGFQKIIYSQCSVLGKVFQSFEFCSSSALTLIPLSARHRPCTRRGYCQTTEGTTLLTKLKLPIFCLSLTVNPPVIVSELLHPALTTLRKGEVKDLLIAFETQPRRIKRLKKVWSQAFECFELKQVLKASLLQQTEHLKDWGSCDLVVLEP